MLDTDFIHHAGRKLTEHPVGFEESDYISWPEDRLVDEMFLELVQKHGWDMLPEQAKRQMIAYSSAKKWTLVYQDRLTESNSLVATDSYLASHIRYLGAESTKQEHASSMSASASPSQVCTTLIHCSALQDVEPPFAGQSYSVSLRPAEIL